MADHPEDTIPTTPAAQLASGDTPEDAAFLFGPAPVPLSEPQPDLPPAADLWQALMARWIGPPEADPFPEPPADIWW